MADELKYIEILSYDQGYIYVHIFNMDTNPLDDESYHYRVDLQDDEGHLIDQDERTSTKSSFDVRLNDDDSDYKIQRGGKYTIQLFIDWEWTSEERLDYPWLETPMIKRRTVQDNVVTILWNAVDKYARTFQFKAKQYRANRWYDKDPLDGNNEVDSDYRNMETQLKLDRFNTEYEVYVITLDEDGHESKRSNIISFKTGPLVKWQWKPNEKAAFNFHGRTNELTAARWREFVGYINAVANAVEGAGYGESWVVVDRELIGVEKDAEMEADYFTGAFSLLKKLCELTDVLYDCPDIETRIKTGQIIYGKYFIDMENALGEIVDKVNNPPSSEEGE